MRTTSRERKRFLIEYPDADFCNEVVRDLNGALRLLRDVKRWCENMPLGMGGPQIADKIDAFLREPKARKGGV